MEEQVEKIDHWTEKKSRDMGEVNPKLILFKLPVNSHSLI